MLEKSGKELTEARCKNALPIVTQLGHEYVGALTPAEKCENRILRI